MTQTMCLIYGVPANTPRGIFANLIGLGGVYPCVDMVIRLVDGKGKVVGYWLKKREAGDQGWQGELHIPGVAGLMTDGIDDVMRRLAKEIFGVENSQLLVNRQLVGTEIHEEFGERHATCWTTVFSLDIEDHVRLSAEWQLVMAGNVKASKGRLKNVVSHHCNTLRWVHDPNRPDFVDLRHGYTPHQIYNACVGVRNYRGQYETERLIEGVKATNPEEAVHLALAMTRLEKAGRDMDKVSYCLPAVTSDTKLKDFARVVGSSGNDVVSQGGTVTLEIDPRYRDKACRLD